MKKVFLCHNSKDKSFVKVVNANLNLNGIPTWFDIEDIPKGADWYKWIFEHIDECGGIFIFIGNNGIGHIQEKEIGNVLREFNEEEKPVVPILIPSYKNNVDIPKYIVSQVINRLNWIDFRNGNELALFDMVNAYKTTIKVKNDEAFKKLLEYSRLRKSWLQFTIAWIVFHILGYICIYGIISSELSHNMKLLTASLATSVILISLLFFGNRQLKISAKTINQSGMYLALITGISISAFIFTKSGGVKLVEQIGAIATIFGTGIIAGKSGGPLWGIITTIFASLGALVAAIMLPYLGTGSNPEPIPIIIATGLWAYLLSLILRYTLSDHKSIYSLLLEISKKPLK
ncbi:toll/interleukin-1 receptor domain-containing protein [Muriicola sp. Z0-33]|uniref:toll/interleukin-1 receptor domain-containing protein n=1 Tax=Muriicola sp. Z0-33 TaxID=2816957 RepID=UPI002238F12B|nr:toll/interleukin-1 receptor domain-containing protein [Muriicola sp. Z0-33]MCW5514733.1 toll/interleukin-1 receptor domain-containing protein [Muriicola sp. Z0-33]